MKTNKNIDRLFQEKLKDFEVSPPDNVWKGIERDLKTNKPKILLPLWLRIGSVAAILVLFTIGGVNYFGSEPTDINDGSIIIVDSDIESNTTIKEEILNKDFLNSTENDDLVTVKESDGNILIADSDEENRPKIKKDVLKKDILNSSKNETLITDVKNNNDKKGVIINETTSDKQQINSKKNQEQNTQNVVANNQSKKAANNLKESNSELATNNNSLKQGVILSKNNKDSKSNNVNSIGSSTSSNIDEIVKNIATENLDKKLSNPNDKLLNPQVDSDKPENTVSQVEDEKMKSLEDTLNENIEEKEKEETKKWSVASVFAPIAYNSFNTKGSPLDLQFENSPKQGSKTMSYGVKVGYKINKKLSLQSGVALVNVGYEIGDVFINPSQQGLQKLANVSYSNSANLLNVEAGDFLSNLQLETNSSTPIKGVLNQEFGYIEVPLELKYKLNNSQKLGINLVGGFSTLFLNKNDVSVETAEFSSNLGEANNLNNVNFSGNLGIDVDYKINKNLYLNVAPMLKIQTSTFSKNADNFKPYILGVYSGLNYKF